MLVVMAPFISINAWMFPEFAAWTGVGMAAFGMLIAPQRATQFEAALPIGARDIAIAQLLLAVGQSFVFLLFALAVGMASSRISIPATVLAQAAMLVVFVVLTPRLLRPKEFNVTPSDTLAPLVVAVTVGALIIYGLTPVLALLTLMGLAAAAGIVWWKALPGSFQSAPLAAANPERRSWRKTADGLSKNLGITPWPLLRQLLLTKQRIGWYVLMVLGGATGSWVMLGIISITIHDLWQRSRWLQQFAISHRARLWCILGPGVLLPCLFALVGMQLPVPDSNYLRSHLSQAPSAYKQEPKYFSSPTRVGIEYWQVASGATAPIITAPWGETAEPYVVHVFGNVLYNPYSSRLASSDRFAKWQYERLTTAVYGKAVPFKEYEEGDVFPRKQTAKLRMMMLNISAVLTVAVLVISVLTVAWHRLFWKVSTLASVISVAAFLTPMAAWLYLQILVLGPQGVTSFILPLIEGQLLRLSAALPANILVVLAVAALPLIATYALLEWQFKKSETVGPMIKL